jgi:hypothetical protein
VVMRQHMVIRFACCIVWRGMSTLVGPLYIIDKKSLSCNQVFHFLYIFGCPSVFYWYAFLAGSLDT